MSELQSFLHMGGYALYVWSSYAITFVVLVANIVFARRQLQQQRLKARRSQQQRNAHRASSPSPEISEASS